ncbi:hypothetical protein RCL1_003283 [Eukaryota sp. TZLM3-RCL]
MSICAQFNLSSSNLKERSDGAESLCKYLKSSKNATNIIRNLREFVSSIAVILEDPNVRVRLVGLKAISYLTKLITLDVLSELPYILNILKHCLSDVKVVIRHSASKVVFVLIEVLSARPVLLNLLDISSSESDNNKLKRTLESVLQCVVRASISRVTGLESEKIIRKLATDIYQLVSNDSKLLFVFLEAFIVLSDIIGESNIFNLLKQLPGSTEELEKHLDVRLGFPQRPSLSADDVLLLSEGLDATPSVQASVVSRRSSTPTKKPCIVAPVFKVKREEQVLNVAEIVVPKSSTPIPTLQPQKAVIPAPRVPSAVSQKNPVAHIAQHEVEPETPPDYVSLAHSFSFNNEKIQKDIQSREEELPPLNNDYEDDDTSTVSHELTALLSSHESSLTHGSQATTSLSDHNDSDDFPALMRSAPSSLSRADSVDSDPGYVISTTDLASPPLSMTVPPITFSSSSNVNPHISNSLAALKRLRGTVSAKTTPQHNKVRRKAMSAGLLRSTEDSAPLIHRWPNSASQVSTSAPSSPTAPSGTLTTNILNRPYHTLNHLSTNFLPSPNLSIRSAISDLGSSTDWETTNKAISAVRAFSIEPSSDTTLIKEALPGLIAQASNLRSSVARNALLALKDVAQTLGRHLDTELPNLLNVLFKRVGESNLFLSEAATDALSTVFKSVSTTRGLQCLSPYFSNLNAIIRAEAVDSLFLLISQNNSTTLNPAFFEKTVVLAANFLGDASPVVRVNAKKIVQFFIENGLVSVVSNVIKSGQLAKDITVKVQKVIQGDLAQSTLSLSGSSHQLLRRNR